MRQAWPPLIKSEIGPMNSDGLPLNIKLEGREFYYQNDYSHMVISAIKFFRYTDKLLVPINIVPFSQGF